VFATFTAPSFGPVHTRVVTSGGKVARCRPRRKADYCPHGRRISCGQRHKEGDACLGKPLCPDCYDYNAAVVWNAHASELWRRTVITIRRRLAKLARQHGTRVKLSYAKVAEFQRRGRSTSTPSSASTGRTRITPNGSSRPTRRCRLTVWLR
jgi:Replication initiator protein, pSAM2